MQRGTILVFVIWARQPVRSGVVAVIAVAWATIPHRGDLGVRSTLKERQHRGLLGQSEDSCVLAEVGERHRKRRHRHGRGIREAQLAHARARELVGHRTLDCDVERGYRLPRLSGNHIQRDIRICDRRTRGTAAGGDHRTVEPGHDIDE